MFRALPPRSVMQDRSLCGRIDIGTGYIARGFMVRLVSSCPSVPHAALGQTLRTLDTDSTPGVAPKSSPFGETSSRSEIQATLGIPVLEQVREW